MNSITQNSTASKVLQALAPYDLKEETPGVKYRCNSPLREGSNSHGFTVTIDDGEHGAYCDHVSNDQGSLYELAQHLRVALPERTPVQDTKRTYKDLADYIAGYGVPVEVFEKAGWHADKHNNRAALKFRTATGNRWRYLDGNAPYYISQPGYARCWYGLDKAAERASAANLPLILCNGERSTVVAQYYGIPACCVTAGEKPAIPDPLLSTLKAAYPAGEILIALDCDPTGNEAAPKLAEQLCKAGYHAKAVDLKLGKGGDLADFCKLHGASAAAKLSTQPALQPANVIQAAARFTFTKTREVLTRPKPTWLYGREIPSNALITLTGASGSGKTFLAIDYALTIAQQSKVVYVAAERPYAALMRGNAWLEHHKAHDDNLVWIEQAPNLTDPADVQALTAAIKAYGAVFVVIDTFSRCADGINEDNNSEVKRIMQVIDNLRRDTGAAVMIVHHTGWGGNRERGASAMRDYAEVALLCEKDGDDTITVSCNKMSAADEFDPRHMRLITIGDQAVAIPSERVLQTAGDKLTKRQLDVLEVLALETFTETGARATVLIKEAKLPEGSAYRVLSALLKLGYVRQAKGGDPYFITGKGESKLSELSRYHHDSNDSPVQPSNRGLSIAITPLGGDSDDSSMGVPRVKAKVNPVQEKAVDIPALALDEVKRLDAAAKGNGGGKVNQANLDALLSEVG
jgi:hypothetical protein